MIAIRRSTILADARGGSLSRLPHLRDVVLRADDPRVERVLSVVRVGAAAPDVESRLLAGDDSVDHADSVYREMLGAGEVPAPPGTTENYNPNDFALFLLGSLTEPGSRTVTDAAKPAGAYGMAR